MGLSGEIIEKAREFAQSRYNYEVDYITSLLGELHLSEGEKKKLDNWLGLHLKTCCELGYRQGVIDYMNLLHDKEIEGKGESKMEELIENEFNEKWVKVENENVLAKIENCLAETKDERFCLEYVADVVENEVGQSIPNEYQGPYMIIGLHGGLNGSGRWNVYLMDVITIIHRLGLMFANVTILDIKNDVPDDVFDVRIVVSGAIKN